MRRANGAPPPEDHRMTHRYAIKALLGASIALALSLSAHAATPTGPSGTRYDVSSLAPGAQYDRFIVTYRDGSTERSNHAALLQNVGAAIGRAGLGRGTAAGGRSVGVQAAYQRKLATGAGQVRTSRKLDSSAAASQIRQIAA